LEDLDVDGSLIFLYYPARKLKKLDGLNCMRKEAMNELVP
jgi:hypothetical protein